MTQPTPKPQLLILAALGLFSPVLAYIWHHVTGGYVHDVFASVLIASYVLTPLAVWYAAAHRRAAMFGYALALILPASVGMIAHNELAQALLLEQNPELRYQRVMDLGVVLIPAIVTFWHFVGAGVLAIGETVRRRYLPQPSAMT